MVDAKRVRRNAAQSTGRDFAIARRIGFSYEIPHVTQVGFGFTPVPPSVRTIRLLRVTDESAASYARANGAFETPDGWHVSVKDPFPFDSLHAHLPRVAWRKVVPEIVDFVPSTAPGMSLAALMDPRDWMSVVGRVWYADLGCHECGVASSGDGSRLVGHEVWNHGVVRRLAAIRLLCSRCLDMHHCGRVLGVHSAAIAAMKPGDPTPLDLFDRAFVRLLAINRVDPTPGPHSEAIAYRHEIERSCFHRSEARGRVTVDLSHLDGRYLRMASDIVHLGRGLLGRRADDGTVAEVAVIVSADVWTKEGRVVVVPRA